MELLQSDAAIHESLQKQAELFCAELLQHPVLSRHREEISIILKGSTAHGYSDCYSDVDLVVFAGQTVKQKITDEYVELGLSRRKDGVFLPLHDWAGHYNTEAYEKLAEIGNRDSIEYLWEYSGSRILHDPRGTFADIVKEKVENFRKNLPKLIRGKYLDCQLQLDWLRQPLRRADYGAAMLYTSEVYSAVCQLLFLYRNQPYPCRKWLPYYFAQLDIPDSLRQRAESLPGLFAQMKEGFSAGLDLMEYPVYRQGFELLEEIKKLLKERFGSEQWIEEWYLYA